MAVRNCPNDIFRTERCITAKENLRMARLHRQGIYLRHVPAVELKADIAFDPGKSIYLTDSDKHIIAFHKNVRFTGWNQRTSAFTLVLGRNLLDQYTRPQATGLGR